MRSTRAGVVAGAATAGLLVHAGTAAAAAAAGLLLRDGFDPKLAVAVAAAALVAAACGTSVSPVVAVAAAWAAASLVDHFAGGLRPSLGGDALSGAAHVAGDLAMHAPPLAALALAFESDGDAFARIAHRRVPGGRRRRDGLAPAAAPEEDTEDRRREGTARHDGNPTDGAASPSRPGPRARVRTPRGS